MRMLKYYGIPQCHDLAGDTKARPVSPQQVVDVRQACYLACRRYIRQAINAC